MAAPADAEASCGQPSTYLTCDNPLKPAVGAHNRVCNVKTKVDRPIENARVVALHSGFRHGPATDFDPEYRSESTGRPKKMGHSPRFLVLVDCRRQASYRVGEWQQTSIESDVLSKLHQQLSLAIDAFERGRFTAGMQRLSLAESIARDSGTKISTTGYLQIGGASRRGSKKAGRHVRTSMESLAMAIRRKALEFCQVTYG